MVDESLIVGSGLRCHSLNMIVHQPILLPGSASGNTGRNKLAYLVTNKRMLTDGGRRVVHIWGEGFTRQVYAS